jgi:hypothetical protein
MTERQIKLEFIEQIRDSILFQCTYEGVPKYFKQDYFKSEEDEQMNIDYLDALLKDDFFVKHLYDAFKAEIERKEGRFIAPERPNLPKKE